ncbi:MAG: hypothetical protein HC849_02815 [Oscillatoriales cyanobacterium RU_3_3]|nr:hypothetical protein [Oscillatoriales cyanobacterium RU_3_3]
MIELNYYLKPQPKEIATAINWMRSIWMKSIWMKSTKYRSDLFRLYASPGFVVETVTLASRSQAFRPASREFLLSKT